MGRTCCLSNCRNSTRNGHRMIKYPSSSKVHKRAQWDKKCGSLLPEKLSDRYTFICEGHFDDDQWERHGWNHEKLKSNALPTVFTKNPPKRHQEIVRRQVPSIEIPKLTSRSVKSENSVEQCQTAATTITREMLLDRIGHLERQLDVAKEQAEQREKNMEKFKANLQKLLNEDQIQCLEIESLSANSREWSEATIRKAIRLKCALGTHGYEFMRKHENYPLPSLRTLRRRLSRLRFEPGLTDEMIRWLADKILHDQQTPDARLCVLSFDEIELQPSIDFDSTTKNYIGLVSKVIAKDQSESELMADHGLAIVVRGLSSRWKQPIAYAFAPKFIPPDRLWSFLDKILRTLHKAGLTVVSMCSNAGPTNQALWDFHGVHGGRTQCQPSFPHPIDTQKKLYASPDVHRVLTNMFTQLLRCDFFIDEKISKANHLSSNRVSMDHVKTLLAERDNVIDPIALHNLKSIHERSDAFDETNLTHVTQLFSEQVGTALISTAKSEDSRVPSCAETTGWFVLRVNEWYKIMSARNPSEALRNDASSSRKIEILRSFVRLVRALTFSSNDALKPVRSCSILATEVVVDFHASHVTTGELPYLLPSRLVTNSCDDIFNRIRIGDVYPKPILLRRAFRSLAVTLLQTRERSSSSDDDDETVGVFTFENAEAMEMDEGVANVDFAENYSLRMAQKHGIYYMAGWTAHKLMSQRFDDCEECDNSVRSSELDETLTNESKKAVIDDGLICPSSHLLEVIRMAERPFREDAMKILKLENVEEALTESILESLPEELNSRFCNEHVILKRAVAQFLCLRLHVLARDSTETPRVVENSTKLGFMRTLRLKAETER